MYDTLLFVASWIVPLVMIGFIFQLLEDKTLRFSKLFGTIAILCYTLAVVFLLGFVEFILMLAGGLI